MNKAIALLLCTAALAWGGCSEDESTDPTLLTSAPWIAQVRYDRSPDRDEWIEYGDKDHSIDLTWLSFSEDGTIEVIDCGSLHNGTFTLDGDQLQIRIYPDTFNFTILQLTGSELVLSRKYYKIVYGHTD